MASTDVKPESRGVAVYCGSSTGLHAAFIAAATSLGHAIAAANRTLVYGGGSSGIMGTVSGAALEAGGKVTGVIPYAMVHAGGEKEKTHTGVTVELDEQGRQAVETVVVDSMHERKVEMAKRSAGFVGLPGGFGTFEEVFEAITWTQIGIHDKPIVLVNALGFWEPVRQLMKSSIASGFIEPENENIVVFIDGPSDVSLHETYDWGSAALKALDDWKSGEVTPMFDWAQTRGGKAEDSFAAS